jgi:hypothetical protein
MLGIHMDEAAKDAPPYYWHRMTLERVHMVWDFYDGPRSGLASFRGKPHYFDCEFDRTQDEYSDTYRLWPVDEEFLALATEQWKIYRAWERRFQSGELTVETHPGHQRRTFATMSSETRSIDG